MMFIIVTGNPVDGLGFIGPFDLASDANEYMDQRPVGCTDWWVTEMDSPSDRVNRMSLLEDALRRAWDYRDRAKAPQSLMLEVEGLLAGVPDRRE